MEEFFPEHEDAERREPGEGRARQPGKAVADPCLEGEGRGDRANEGEGMRTETPKSCANAFLRRRPCLRRPLVMYHDMDDPRGTVSAMLALEHLGDADLDVYAGHIR